MLQYRISIVQIRTEVPRRHVASELVSLCAAKHMVGTVSGPLIHRRLSVNMVASIGGVVMLSDPMRWSRRHLLHSNTVSFTVARHGQQYTCPLRWRRDDRGT